MSRCFASVLAVALGGCVPIDPHETLERARGGTLRVGATSNQPFVFVDEQGRICGTEASRVRAFADELDADIEWTVDQQDALMRRIEKYELDLAIGGILEGDPWAKKVGTTRPYVEDEEGKHVLVVAPGENAFLLELERFLARYEAPQDEEACR